VLGVLGVCWVCLGLVGKGYGVRASEYGLAPSTVQVRNIRTDTHSIP